MSLVYIRQGRYTDALSCLNESTVQAANTPDSLALGSERLKLWLFLEEGSTKAESQYKHLVRKTLKKELPEGDRIETCGFIGNLMGMLESDQIGSNIELANLEKGQSAIQKMESLTNGIRGDYQRSIFCLEDPQVHIFLRRGCSNYSYSTGSSGTSDQ